MRAAPVPLRGHCGAAGSFRQCVLGIPAIVALFAHPLGRNRSGIARPPLVIKLGQQALEPTRLPGGLHSHAHTGSRILQLAIELLGLAAVPQPTFSARPTFCIHPCDLLHAGVIITPYNPHVRPPFSRATWSFALPTILRSEEADDSMKKSIN